MSLPPVSISPDCLNVEPIKQLDPLPERSNSCSRLRITARVLSVTNRFLKAKNARETNLIALAEGIYQKNCSPIRVYYANRQQVQDVVLPQLKKWKKELRAWDRDLEKKSKSQNQRISLFEDRSTLGDSLTIVEGMIKAFSHRSSSASL